MNQTAINQRDEPSRSSNGAIPGVINKKIALDKAEDDRDIAAAAVVESFYEAFPPGVPMPDEWDFHAHGQMRNRHQRPGAHVVIHADSNGKRKFVLNGTTKDID